jgi:dephospho-CoA kinase
MGGDFIEWAEFGIIVGLMESDHDKKIEQDAYRYIAGNKDLLIQRFANPEIFKPVERPVSLFMAGSPGAGKTEVSRSLIKKFEVQPIRIDADEIRKMCEKYEGDNAHLFQKAATKGVHILFDYALKHNIHAIIDGTFAYEDAIKNIERSIKHKRIVELWFVYQDPIRAWEFTKIREAVESRHVDKKVFISSFLKAKNNAMEAKNTFGSTLELNLLVKNIDNTTGKPYLNIQAAELDPYIGKTYTEAELNLLLI